MRFEGNVARGGVPRVRASRSAAAFLVGALALAAGSAAALDPERAVDHYTRRAWSLEQGLPQSTVNDIVQDRDGYLWLATFGGLVRFDGVTPTVLLTANEPGLPSDRITALAVDDAGALWVGTEEAGLAVRRNGVFERVATAAGGVSVTRLLAARGGGVWAATSVGLFRAGAGPTRHYGKEAGLPDGSVLTVANGPGGEIWVGKDVGLCVLQGSRCVPRFVEALEGHPVYCIRSGRAGTFIGTSRQLFEVVGEVAKGSPFVRGAAVRTLLLDSRGSVWAGQDPGGLRRIRPREETLDRSGGLPGDSVKSLFEDREGNLWVGFSGSGLARLGDGAATGIGVVVDGVGVSTLPVVSDGAGGVFVGTRCEGVAHVDASGVRFLGGKDGRLRECVWSLLAGEEGDLWIGTFGRGLLRRRSDGRVERIAGPPSGGKVIRALARSGGKILAGGDDGVFAFDPRTSAVEKIDWTEGLEIYLIDVEEDGTLWLGTSEGLHVLSGATRRTFSTANGLSSDFVRAVLRDPTGVVWVGTYGGGLNRIEGDRVTVYGTRNGLFEDVVSRIVEDSTGRFWMTGNRGVTRVDRARLEAFARTGEGPLDAELFDATSGMRTSECNGGGQPAGHLGEDGRFWVPTVDGLAVFETRREARNAVPPPVRIEEVRLGGRSVEAVDGLVLPAGARNLEIQYTALSLRRPEKVRFRRWLHGLDEGWVDAGNRRIAYYPYLPPGSYRFQVAAANDDGVWNEEGASLSFTREARFVQTRAFPALLVLAVALAGAGTVRFVRLVARRREAELARLVAERTAELARLVDIAEQVNRGHRVDEVLDHVYDSLREVIPYDRVGLALLDEDRLVLRALWSRSEARRVEIAKGYEAPVASSSLREVLETGEPRILNDLEAYLAAHPESESTRRIVQEGVRSSLTLPLRSEGVPVGVVFFSSFEKGVYDASHARLLAGIAGHLSMIVAKSRLYDDLVAARASLEAANRELERLASADALTGLPNRRAFDEALATEWRRAGRAQSPVTILLADVDQFKAFNDLYGHGEGDVCLREVARALASRVKRAGDMVARWGGEEFAAVLHDCGPEEARLVAERLRDVVAQRRIPHAGSSTGFVTVSVGAASQVPRTGQEPADLVRRADEALYAAKRAGRNRSEVVAV